MTKKNNFYKENKTFVSLLVGCIILLALFVGVATGSGAWPGTDASSQILSALAGAVVAAIITLFLLLGQTSSEEKKERNTKVFEERLRIYQEFLHKLCDVVKDQKIESEEEIELEFQVAYIAMHTSSDSIKAISDQVREIVVNIKKGESDSNEMLSQLFVIADTFYNELYGMTNDYNEEDRSNTILNFNSILVAKEDIRQYEDEQKEAVVNSLSGKELSLEERTRLLMAMINPNGFKQWIWNGTTLVHELYTDKSEKTGNFIKSKNMIVIDMMPGTDEYIICLFTRVNSEERTRELAEGIWGAGKFNPSPFDSTRHVAFSIPYSESNEKIAKVISQIMEKVKSYRDNKYSNA